MVLAGERAFAFVFSTMASWSGSEAGCVLGGVPDTVAGDVAMVRGPGLVVVDGDWTR